MSYFPNINAAGLIEILDLDLSQLSPAVYAGDGIKTIGGKAAWRLKNSANGQLIALNDGVHAGLYTRCSTFSSANYGSLYNGPRWVVGLNDLCGVNQLEAYEQWVLLLFSQPHVPNTNYEYAYLGISVLPGADTDTNHTTPVFEMIRGFTTPAIVGGVEWQKGTTVVQNPAGVTVPNPSHDVYAFRIVTNDIIEAYSGSSVGGSWPALTDLSFVGRAKYFSPAQGFQIESFAVSTTFQWALVLSCAASNTNGLSDLLIRKLKILYR